MYQLKSILKIFLTLLVIGLLSACNENEIKELENENAKLSEMVDELTMELETKLEELETLKNEEAIVRYETQSNDFLLKHCEEQFQAYKYGKNKSLTRYDKALGRQVTVYGAENIIDFLNRHYSPN